MAVKKRIPLTVRTNTRIPEGYGAVIQYLSEYYKSTESDVTREAIRIGLIQLGLDAEMSETVLRDIGVIED